MQGYGSPYGVHAMQCRTCGCVGVVGSHFGHVDKISTAGWVTFWLLMIFCFPLFWIGLLMKERRLMCRNCGAVGS